ncbi:MAG TPA: tRNA (adenosine(37)-N6)-threonylcarbamoyltransferase complex ATPase subunit type 1 TsaE [Clostridiales bacterium]|nr:tRNA (adenosine(37)-N6)-threonylcarbamoyltransferase complex ATPase subunit type 1 TsaE [Clostridiales bacterium]
MKYTYITKNHEETFRLAKGLAPYLKEATNLLVDGALAAGKTVFAKGLGEGLGVKATVKSPSYTLLCIYEGRLPFYHFDAYHLNNVEDFYGLGFDEYLKGGVALIEWASVIKDGFPGGYIHVEIAEGEAEDERKIMFSATDDFHRDILEEWQRHEDSCL